MVLGHKVRFSGHNSVWLAGSGVIITGGSVSGVASTSVELYNPHSQSSCQGLHSHHSHTWYVTRDMWHVARASWHVTCNMCYFTHWQHLSHVDICLQLQISLIPFLTFLVKSIFMFILLASLANNLKDVTWIPSVPSYQSSLNRGTILYCKIFEFLKNIL